MSQIHSFLPHTGGQLPIFNYFTKKDFSGYFINRIELSHDTCYSQNQQSPQQPIQHRRPIRATLIFTYWFDFYFHVTFKKSPYISTIERCAKLSKIIIYLSESKFITTPNVFSGLSNMWTSDIDSL
jgi:hypothetical protein